MTVCIAAYSPLIRMFVAVSDTMICNDVQSADAATFKASPLTDNAAWFAFYSSENYVEPDTLVRRVRAALKQAKTVELETVVTATEEAYAAEILKRANAYLSPLGISRADFLADGQQIFGCDEFTRRTAELFAAAKLSTELLVCGFDGDGGHILSSDQTGVTSVHDKVGFHAVGAGAWVALESLYLDPKFRLSTNLIEIIYRLCAAKFAAESAPSVGQDTIVLVRGAGEKDAAFLFGQHLTRLRELWRHHMLTYPPDALLEIAAQLKNVANEHAAAVAYLKSITTHPPDA